MSSPPDRVGQEIAGRYEIQSLLGSGGMATAWLAVDRRVRRSVVVKIPHEELVRQPDFRERFQREVRRMSELQHPGVVPLYDCGEEESGLPYCVVRYLPGGDLADRVDAAGGRIPAVEIARWLPDVAAALDYIHAAGIVHRDVSPANILFDEDGNVFLSDFGVAAIFHAVDETAPERDETQLTAEGSFAGAAIYAPPEAVARELTPAYDQYSLALVLYQALSGCLPFPQVDPRSLLMAKNSEAPAPLDQRGVPIPPAACHAVMRGLSPRKEDRFPSCRNLADAFLAADEGVATREILLPGVPSRSAAGRAARGMAVGVALLATLVAGVWLARETLRAPEENAGESVLAGTFQMGTTPAELAEALALCRAHAADCAPSRYEDETLREVEVGPFALDRFEVTNREFAAFVADTGYETTAETRGTSRDGPFAERSLSWRTPAGPRSSHLDLPDHPVVHMSAADAEAYCAHAGKRLPTEAEWEFAARGEERRVFAWGSEWSPEMASWARDKGARLHTIGRFPPGPFGHHDLTGNVWEWTATPVGSARVLKGGSWMETNPADLRSAVRLLSPESDTSSDIGFRCAWDVAQ